MSEGAFFKPLEGIRVIDFTHVYQGPTCTLILADFGADVIKVERPGTGDWSRSFGPYLHGESLPFISLNRNKRSIVVSLHEKEGKEITYKLVEKSDVVVNNFRPGTMERLGLGYEDLKKINPKIIYAESSGYGRTGPYAERNKPGHDKLGQAIGGLFEFKPGDLPRSVGRSTDLTSGMLLTIGILLALFEGEHTGMGQHVETNLLNAAVFMHLWQSAAILNPKDATKQLDQSFLEEVFQTTFRTADGYIALVPLFRVDLLKKLSYALGIKDLSEDPRFSTVEKMVENKDDLNETLQKVFLRKTTDEWIKILEAHNILCAPINTPEEAFRDPQVIHNGMIVEVTCPMVGKTRILGIPIKLSKTPGSIRRPPPLLGQHTDEILKELGYTVEQIADLRRRGIIR